MVSHVTCGGCWWTGDGQGAAAPASKGGSAAAAAVQAASAVQADTQTAGRTANRRPQHFERSLSESGKDTQNAGAEGKTWEQPSNGKLQATNGREYQREQPPPGQQQAAPAHPDAEEI